MTFSEKQVNTVFSVFLRSLTLFKLSAGYVLLFLSFVFFSLTYLIQYNDLVYKSTVYSIFQKNISFANCDSV